jgi:hypothetical protein
MYIYWISVVRWSIVDESLIWSSGPDISLDIQEQFKPLLFQLSTGGWGILGCLKPLEASHHRAGAFYISGHFSLGLPKGAYDTIAGSQLNQHISQLVLSESPKAQSAIQLRYCAAGT